MLSNVRVEKISGNDKVDHSILYIAIAFLVALTVFSIVSFTFRKSLRNKVNTKIMMPILGFAIVSIPLILDTNDLVAKGNIDNLFGTYFQEKDFLVKTSIYLLSLALIFRRERIVVSLTPLVVLLIAFSQVNKQQNGILYTVDHFMAIGTILSLIFITGRRYSFINFAETMIAATIMISSVVLARVLSSSELTDINNLRTRSFQTFLSYDGGGEQIVLGALFVVVVSLGYLLINTKVILKASTKQAMAIIAFEEKFRKLEIEVTFEQKDILDKDIAEIILEEEYEVSFIDHKVFEAKENGSTNDFLIKLNKLFVKAKGIRSPSL